MRLSGYQVRIVYTENGYLPEAANKASSIAVISLDKPQDQILALAKKIETQSQGCVRIFVLADPGALNPRERSIEVIERPYHLAEVVKRIQNLNRGK